MEKEILMVGVPLQYYDKLKPRLDGFEIDRVLRAEEALITCSATPYRVLVVGFPLYTMPVEDFLAGLRRAASASKNAAVMLLAHPGKRLEAEKHLGTGARRICSMDEDPEEVREALESFSRSARRIPSRIMIRLLITREGREVPLLCQSENLSSTGMFVYTDKELPLETEVSFQFMLPWDHKAVRGTCVVARHAKDAAGNLTGLGFRYLSFEEEDEERYKTFLLQKDPAVAEEKTD